MECVVWDFSCSASGLNQFRYCDTLGFIARCVVPAVIWFAMCGISFIRSWPLTVLSHVCFIWGLFYMGFGLCGVSFIWG